MSDAPGTSRPSNSGEGATGRFIRGAGNVQDKRLWGPARWVVQMVQYLVAIMAVTIAQAFKSIVSGESGRKRKAPERVD